MRWYTLVCTLAIATSAYSQHELAVDTTQVNQLLELGRKDQWIDAYRCLNYADQALKQAQEINYRKGIATALNLKGFCYWTFGDNDLAITSSLEALDIARTDKYPRIQAESYYIMARGYMDLRENNKAHEAIVKAEALANEGNDWAQLCSIYNLKGVILYGADKYDSALYFYNKAYEIGKNNGVDPINLPRIISNIGEVYARENPVMGFRYFNEALDLAKQTNNKIAEASITSIIGHAYLRDKNLKNAESNLQSALKLAQSLGLRRVMRHAYGGLVDIRLAQGKGNEAIVYLQRYYAVRDSLLNTSKIREIVELEAKHELALREKNIQLLENQKRIDTIWRYVLIGLVAIVVVGAVAIIRWQRFRYKKNREILNLEIDQLKSLQLPEIDDTVSSYDQRLLKQAISIVEDNIADSQLSVEKLAEQLHMSRTSLHRKIKAITGFPPSELIRSIRLRKAARMIVNRVDSAAQIAQAVGFEDYSHFSKAFKKHFGVSPSGYEDQAKTQASTFQKAV